MANTHEYDAFISHAVEDKIAIANDLNEALRARGLKIWYSGQELSVGDPLINTITEGLQRSRFGIIIVSPTYLTKIWALTELNHFLHKTNGTEKVILPVLLMITPEQLAPQIPRLADLFAVRAEKGVDFVADTLFRTIQNARADEESKRKSSQKRWLLGALGVILLVGILGYFLWSSEVADRTQIRVALDAKVDHFTKNAGVEFVKAFNASDTVGAAEAASMFTQYAATKSYYRNEYRLSAGGIQIRAKKNVESALEIDLDALTPLNSFGMDSVRILLSRSTDESGRKIDHLAYINLSPVQYQFETLDAGEDLLNAKVSFSNGLRFVGIKLIYPNSASDTKRYVASLEAFLPLEDYHFVRKAGRWELEPAR